MFHYQSTIIYCLLVLWGLTELFIKNKTSKNTSNHSKDQGTRYIIITSVVLSIAMLNNPIKPYLLPEWGIYLGIFLMIFGIIFRLYAIHYLGKAFTLNVQTTDTQKLISSGPYSLVRNPAYTGSILSILGLSFVTLNILSILTTLSVFEQKKGFSISILEKTIRTTAKRLDIVFSHLFGK